MEKEPNTNSMEETATMPSYFPCIKSSESHPLADWLYLKSVITSSPELRMMTETYRKVSIRSTPYCKSQNNVVTLHGGIIFPILKQKYAV